jgi:hypothetical protein
MMLIVTFVCNGIECSHIKHNKSRHHQPKVDGKSPVGAVMVQTDGSDQNSAQSDSGSSVKKSERSVLNLDEYCSIAADLVSLNRTNESKLPLNSPDNTEHPFICPGCRKDFKLFSGFVLHIENRSCKSPMCHEIEDRINSCATQLFDTFT